MRKLILMTSAAIIAPLSGFAENITCTATPNCADLGYTESSCPDNKGVKCPWGDTYFCPPSEAEICEKNGFVYTCDGEKQTGGVGETCHEKYAECSCYSGYKWDSGQCAETKWVSCGGYVQNCSIGDILFSDGTCHADVVEGKTAIGVVVYVNSEGCGQAMALKPLESAYQWASAGSVKIPGISIASDNLSASYDFRSCENTAMIIAAGDKSTYPAAWAAHDYKAEGTNSGDWCLPAAGVFTSYYNNQDVINNAFNKVGGTPINTGEFYWSSTDHNGYYKWSSNFSKEYGINYNISNGGVVPVRPIIEF